MIDFIAFSPSCSDLEPVFVRVDERKNDSYNWIKNINTNSQLVKGKNKVCRLKLYVVYVFKQWMRFIICISS